MLPLPIAPSTSRTMSRARLRAAFARIEPRVFTAFWLFGLINNVLYVIILSAALDLVGPDVPKGVVLLADVIPSFLTKLCAPYFIHAIPYWGRILLFVALSTCGMLLVALTPAYTDGGTVTAKMAGVVLASLSSGGGELSFLGLTHYYGSFSLAAWGSGTGAAGLVGAGAYAIATTALKMSVKSALLASALLPVVMLVSFFVILPKGPLLATGYAKLKDDAVAGAEADFPGVVGENELSPSIDDEDEGLLSLSQSQVSQTSTHSTWWHGFRANLQRSRNLFFPFMLPLLLVYIAEYTINQGVTPTLLFPLPNTPFTSYRSFYPTYASIYQLGVFISRSSTPFFRVHNLYLPSFLQVANLFLLIAHALFDFLPNVWIVFVVIFWEGLLGGLVYVNTFAEILDTVPRREREFSLGATSVSDSGGICLAGFLSMGIEVWLCGWQVRHGREFCKLL